MHHNNKVSHQGRHLHVLHVLNGFGVGGAEMGVARLVGMLQGEGLSHSVCSLSADMALRSQLAVNVPAYSLNIARASYTAWLKLALIVRRKAVDIIHVNNLGPWLDGFLAARLTGRKCVMTFHGIETSALQMSRFKRFLYSGLLRKTDIVTAVSNSAGELMAKGVGGAGRFIFTIPNGVDCLRFTPAESEKDKENARKEFGLPVSGSIFGSVAALRPVKNHRELIEAFSSCSKESADRSIFLAIAGDGPEKANLQYLVESNGLEGKVFFLGHCSNVGRFLQAVDAFCLTSISEGMSYSILEAMASGLPVFTTAVGANTELVIPGETGYLYASGDKVRLTEILCRAVSRADCLIEMGRRARQKVEKNYSLSTMAEEYRRVYLSITNH